MTRASANLLAVRSLLLLHLDILPGSPSADLTPAEVGIVGDPNHRGGYHCGSDRLDSDDYSVRESPRDRAGLTLDAAALDVGWFEVRSAGATHNMRTFAVWCVNQCRANTPDSRDIREIIYSPDGKVVRRYDRLGKRTTGDSSHLSHNHFSFFRDAVKAGRDQRPLFTRYLTEIGLLPSEEDMEQNEKLLDPTGVATRLVANTLGDLQNFRNNVTLEKGNKELIAPPKPNSLLDRLDKFLTAFPTVAAQLAELSGKDFTDEQAIVDGVLSGLGSKPLDDVATTLRSVFGAERAAELGALLANSAS